MTTSTATCLAVRVGMGVFVVRDGKFLMGIRRGSHGADTWSVPGGHQEFGESFEDTTRREVLEETGLQLGDVSMVGITNDYNPEWMTHHVTLWMLADCPVGEPQELEPKFVNQGWYDFTDLPDPLFFPWQQLMRSSYYADLLRRIGHER